MFWLEHLDGCQYYLLKLGEIDKVKCNKEMLNVKFELPLWLQGRNVTKESPMYKSREKEKSLRVIISDLWKSSDYLRRE